MEELILPNLRGSNALQHVWWEVSVTCHMRKGFTHSTSSRWNTGASELILVFIIFKVEVNLSPSVFFIRPPRPRLRGHTYRLLKGPGHLRRRSGTFSVRVVQAPLVMPSSVSVGKKKLDRQWTEIIPAAYFQFLFPFTDVFIFLSFIPKFSTVYMVMAGTRGQSYH